MRPHKFEPTSLIFGLVFIGVGATFIRGDVEIWQLNWSWFLPGVLLVSGLLIVGSALSSRNRSLDQRNETQDNVL